MANKYNSIQYRGAKVLVVLTSNYYKRSLVVQVSMEIPRKVTVEVCPTLKNTQLMDHLMELVKTLCSEPNSPIVLGLFLVDEFEVEFLSNETGQKSPKVRKEEKARRKMVNITK